MALALACAAAAACSPAAANRPSDEPVLWTALSVQRADGPPAIDCPDGAQSLGRISISGEPSGLQSVLFCLQATAARLLFNGRDAQGRSLFSAETPVGDTALAEFQAEIRTVEQGDLDVDGRPELAVLLETNGLLPDDIERRQVHWIVVRMSRPAGILVDLPVDRRESRQGDCIEDWTRTLARFTFRSNAKSRKPPDIVGFTVTEQRQCTLPADATACSDEPPPCKGWQRQQPLLYRYHPESQRYIRMEEP